MANDGSGFLMGLVFLGALFAWREHERPVITSEVKRIPVVTIMNQDQEVSHRRVSNQYNLYIDPGFTKSEIKEIDIAVKDWHQKVGVEINQIVWNADCDYLTGEFNLCIHASDMKYVQSCIPKAIGFTTVHDANSNDNIYIAVDLPNKKMFIPLIEHEIGHGMGLNHSSNETDLMFAVLDNYHITENDIKAFKNIR